MALFFFCGVVGAVGWSPPGQRVIDTTESAAPPFAASAPEAHHLDMVNRSARKPPAYSPYHRHTPRHYL